MCARTILLCAAVLALVLVASAGVPRPGRFQGALNRGRECYFTPERAECSEFVKQQGEKKRDNAPQEEWFTGQRLDHFNMHDHRTWPQRYWVNATYFKPGGPVFLLLGGEGPTHATDVSGHFAVSEQAEQFNAMTISLEHRFYGSSMPLPSTATENLYYLTSQQALADAAAFQQWLPTVVPAVNQSRWVVFGGSYSGNLAAWYREKYPHLVAGAIASSAPVHAQLDFPEYLETVAASLGSSCSNQFAVATKSIEQLLDDPTGAGREQLEELFNTCDPIRGSLDAATFLGFITDEVAGIVQYNNDNNNYEPMNITSLCEIMESDDYPDPMHAWASWINDTTSCVEASYDKTVREMRITTRLDTAARSWYWQTCTEFGYYQTGSSSNQPFSPRITLDYFLQLCNDVYELDLTPDTAWINQYFGSTNLQGSRIILPNGSIDPWHTLGVLNRPNLQEDTVLMTGTAHVADLYPPREQDLDVLTQTRELEMQLVARWLQLPVATSK